MAEMKFVESQLQSFDIQAKPPVTHSKISQMQKVRWTTKKKRRSKFVFEKDLENSRCEYEILQQKLDHLMPCDEPVRFEQMFWTIDKENIVLFFSSVLDDRQFNK